MSFNEVSLEKLGARKKKKIDCQTCL